MRTARPLPIPFPRPALALGTLLIGSSLLFGPSDARAQVAINTLGLAPNPSAMLDISATNRGVLVPRMTSAQRAGIAGAANGLIVYQTNDATNSPRGYWYFDGTLPGWVPLNSGGGNWGLRGNAGTNPATDFLGPTDNQGLSFRTNGTERMRLYNTGRLGVNGPANETVEINGGLAVTGGSATNQAGAIRLNAASNAHDGNIDGTVNGWYRLENIFTEQINQDYQVVISSCAPNVVTIGAGVTTTLGTIETPYSTSWEDGRHQYLYLASELAAAQICPNENITALGFNVASNGALPVNAVEIKMKNTTTNTMTNFDYTGLQLVNTTAVYNTVGGWNTHNFNVAPFQWNGTANVIVEFCFNNTSWAGLSSVRADNVTGYNAMYGLYCDACGGTGPVPCGTPPNVGIGALGGCELTNTSSLVTCDGTFQWVGSQAGRQKRVQIRFTAQTGASVIVLNQGDYVYSGTSVMIGDPAWAQGGGPLPSPYAFKGPGTISAQNGVWGGGTLLSDHVFDIHFDGAPRPTDTERAAGYRHYPINEMVNYVERERHLPTIAGREEWNEHGPFPVDALGTQLWVTVEEQALYIQELNERMRLLEEFLLRKQLDRATGN